MSETVFTYAAPGLKFGRGASDEIGWDVQQLCRDGAPGGARRVLLVTDRKLPALAYIDDRAVRFTTWDQTMQELNNRGHPAWTPSTRE